MIERLSTVLPEKELKKLYIRDCIGQIARICNDSVENLFKYEYSVDTYGKEFVKEYRLEEDDGFTFIDTYIGRIFARSKNEYLNEDVKELLLYILARVFEIISDSDSSRRQIRVNQLEDYIKKWLKKEGYNKFIDCADYLIYCYCHDSLTGYLAVQYLCLLVQVIYTPYNLCYYDIKGKPILYTYDNIYKGYNIGSFLDVNVDQSAQYSDEEAMIFGDQMHNNHHMGAMRSFNVAYSLSSLRKLKEQYSKLMFTEKYVMDKSISASDAVNDYYIANSARYHNGIIRAFLGAKHIDNTDEVLLDYLHSNRLKLCRNISYYDHESYPAILLIENLKRFVSYDIKFKFDICRRRFMFTNGITIKYTFETLLLKGIEVEYFIYEYIKDNKLHIFFGIKSEYGNNYYVLREGDYNILTQCIDAMEFILLCCGICILNNGDFFGSLCEMQEKLMAKESPRNHDEHTDNILSDAFRLFLCSLIEASDILDNDRSISTKAKGKKVYVNEMYTEAVKFVPFLRRLPVGQVASDKAKELAKKMRIELPQGYTIVEEHIRNIKKKV